MVTSCHRFLHWNNTIKKDDGTLTTCSRLLLFKHKENKTHKKTTKKKPRERRELRKEKKTQRKKKP
jgi:hypothetical protein